MKTSRGVVPGGAIAPYILADQLTLSQTGRGGGGKLCPPNDIGTAGFSDLPTGMLLVNVVLLRLFNFRLSTSSSRTSMHQTLLVKWMEGKREKK
jgi:hypothetical protein